MKGSNDTCFSSQQLESLQRAYNETFSKTPIRGDVDKFWARLKKKFAASGGRPQAPSSWTENRYDWLSNWDIEDVMKAYEHVVPDFKFLGCHSIDFDKKNRFRQCYVSELCNVNIAEWTRGGKYRLGIVFNLDEHDKPGSHWVAMYCDLRPGVERVVFFDSYSAKPEKEFQRLMLRWSSQWKCIAGHGLRAYYNSLRHQHKNSECGMYSIYFLHCCIFEIPLQHRIPDDIMNGMRSLFFKFGKKA